MNFILCLLGDRKLGPMGFIFYPKNLRETRPSVILQELRSFAFQLDHSLIFSALFSSSTVPKPSISAWPSQYEASKYLPPYSEDKSFSSTSPSVLKVDLAKQYPQLSEPHKILFKFHSMESSVYHPDINSGFLNIVFNDLKPTRYISSSSKVNRNRDLTDVIDVRIDKRLESDEDHKRECTQNHFNVNTSQIEKKKPEAENQKSVLDGKDSFRENDKTSGKMQEQSTSQLDQKGSERIDLTSKDLIDKLRNEKGQALSESENSSEIDENQNTKEPPSTESIINNSLTTTTSMNNGIMTTDVPSDDSNMNNPISKFSAETTTKLYI